MFGLLFKQNDEIKTAAHDLYECALMSTRNEIFYSKYKVPDTFDGRFDLLLLHIFLILHRSMGQKNYSKLAQALFDTTFRDMDQTLREMGIGDMGVPKHTKRMMKAFNGRMHSYQMALNPQSIEKLKIEGLSKTTLKEALRRNLYGTIQDEHLDANAVQAMCNFVEQNAKSQDPKSFIINAEKR